LPQAPSSDTAGWFAGDASTFARVSEVMLGEAVPTTLPGRLVVATDAFGFADAETAAALQPRVDALAKLVRDVREDLLAPPGLSVWARAQRTLQPYEAWQALRAWLDRDTRRPRELSPGESAGRERRRIAGGPVHSRRAGQRYRTGGGGGGDGGRSMTDVTPNIPEVVAEVRALFERYEQALVDRDVAVLDAT